MTAVNFVFLLGGSNPHNSWHPGSSWMTWTWDSGQISGHCLLLAWGSYRWATDTQTLTLVTFPTRDSYDELEHRDSRWDSAGLVADELRTRDSHRRQQRLSVTHLRQQWIGHCHPDTSRVISARNGYLLAKDKSVPSPPSDDSRSPLRPDFPRKPDNGKNASFSSPVTLWPFLPGVTFTFYTLSTLYKLLVAQTVLLKAPMKGV